MKQRFLLLHPKQQLMVAGGLALVLAVALAAGMLSLHRGNAALQQQLEESSATLKDVQDLSAQLQQLSSSADGPVDLTSAVTESLRTLSLQPSRLQQNGADELQLRLDGVAYADAVAWLAVLEQTAGIAIVRISMTPSALIVSVRRL